MKAVGFPLLSLSACSMRRVAVNPMGEALSGKSGVYAAYDNPELIQEASPFLLALLITHVPPSPWTQGR